jgi:hypothetical protein
MTPRVQVHEVDLAERAQRLLGQFLHRLSARHVGPHGEHGRAAVGELGARIVEARFLDVGEHHLHTFGRAPRRHRPADAAGRAGDDGDLVAPLSQHGVAA